MDDAICVEHGLTMPCSECCDDIPYERRVIVVRARKRAALEAENAQLRRAVGMAWRMLRKRGAATADEWRELDVDWLTLHKCLEAAR